MSKADKIGMTPSHNESPVHFNLVLAGGSATTLLHVAPQSTILPGFRMFPGSGSGFLIPLDGFAVTFSKRERENMM